MTASREAARATMPARVAENLKLRAEEQLAAAETALASAISAEAKEQAEGAKAQAVARIAELQAQWATAKTELQPKLDAVTFMREAAVSAEAARVAAADAARQVAHGVEPLSVLISRQTQRLYVRQAFEPILESPVTILDADRPIGTHIFTAMERANGDTNMRWERRLVGPWTSERSRDRATRPTRGGPRRRANADRSGWRKGSARPDCHSTRRVGSYRRLVPRSSLIITDEALSSETGNNTDFVVLLSGEPQGGIKFRQRDPGALHDRLPYWRSPLPGPFSIW